MIRRAALSVAVLSVAACVAPEQAPRPTAEGMSAQEAKITVSEIFEAAGCSLTIAAYGDRLDALGFDPDLHDVTTPQGHLAMINRSILESTPLLLVNHDQFTRRGSKLTSHIGGCA